jgi:hypothetical protein
MTDTTPDPRWTIDDPTEAAEAPEGTYDVCDGHHPEPGDAMAGVALPDAEMVDRTEHNG